MRELVPVKLYNPTVSKNLNTPRAKPSNSVRKIFAKRYHRQSEA